MQKSDDFDFLDDVSKIEVDGDILKQLTKLTETHSKYSDALKILENRIKNGKKLITQIEEEFVPNLMQEAGMKEFKTKDFNITIKKVAEDARLRNPKQISSYTARYSWAQIASSMGYNLEVIGDAFGHENRGTTKVYVPSPNQQILDEMNEKVVG